jgi:hypothetical protein
MVNRLAIVKFLVPMMCLLASTGLEAQNTARYTTDAEKAEWIKSHPEEYKRMGGTTVTGVTAGEAQSKSEPKALAGNPMPDQKTAPQPKGNPNYTPTLSESQIPAVYKQASDYNDPMVRERIEQEIKAGRTPQVADRNAAPTGKDAIKSNVSAVAGTAQQTPAEWPAYRTTGDKAADDAAYAQGKDAYIANQEATKKAATQSQEDQEMQAKLSLLRAEEAAAAKKIADEQRLIDQEMAAKQASLKTNNK